MKVLEPGHIYQLNWLDGKAPLEGNTSTPWDLLNDILVFVNREEGTQHAGTQTQEVIRALIDRTQHCDRCLRWEGNDLIVHHLRMALALHEALALLRKTQKGYIQPEHIVIGEDGHFAIIGETK